MYARGVYNELKRCNFWSRNTYFTAHIYVIVGVSCWIGPRIARTGFFLPSSIRFLNPRGLNFFPRGLDFSARSRFFFREISFWLAARRPDGRAFSIAAFRHLFFKSFLIRNRLKNMLSRNIYIFLRNPYKVIIYWLTK